jgi:protein involved in polysaccharide export with SLBB domain
MDLTRRFSVTLAVVAALTAAGCAGPGTSSMTTTQSIRPVESAPQGFAQWTDEIPAYRFIAGDKIRVQFLLTPEVNEDAIVSPDGHIGLRAAGQVMAGGLTAEELQDAVTKAARKNLQNPIVTASLVESPGARVFIGGMVLRSGAYPLDGRRGALEAVILAGGFSPEARMDQVVLIRRNPQNRPMLRTVDLRDFVNQGTTAADMPLVPGDIVFVPRNGISEVDLWIDQFINKFLPFEKVFNYTINRNPIGSALF